MEWVAAGGELTPAHLSPTIQSHTQREKKRERERTGGMAAGQGDTGCSLGGVAGADVIITALSETQAFRYTRNNIC
jgi:hypothetical protein